MTDILSEVGWNLGVVLICIPLMPTEVVVLVRVSIVVIKTMTKRNLKRRGFISASLSLKEVRVGIQTREEPKQELMQRPSGSAAY